MVTAAEDGAERLADPDLLQSVRHPHDVALQIRVRRLEDWVVGWFRGQARRHGRSLEGEVRAALTDAALSRKREIGAEIRRDLESLRQRYGLFADSAPLIREDRDDRG